VSQYIKTGGQPSVEHLMATVWTRRSQARVGSYQHLVSSGPWMILAAEEGALRDALLSTPTHRKGE
jgi:hypothetical protein